MGTLFLAVASQAGNGPGAAVDFAAMGASKTIIASGSWVLPPQVSIEVNNDPAQAGSWQSIATFQGSGRDTVEIAAKWLRVNVQNFRGGMAPIVNVGGDDSGTDFLQLVAPAGNGVGAAVDVSGLGLFKSVQIGGPFRGSTIIEISTDAGTTWAQAMAFSAPGIQTQSFAAEFMRVSRNGVPQVAPGLPIVNIGACDFAAGGGGGVDLENGGVALAGGPFNALNLLGGLVATDAGLGTADVQGGVQLEDVGVPIAGPITTINLLGGAVPTLVAPGIVDIDAGVFFENAGAPIAGGPHSLLDLIGITATDLGSGAVELAVAGSVMALPEVWTNDGGLVAANVANVALVSLVSQNFDTVLAMHDGCVIGLRVRLTSPVTAGQLTVQVTINGVVAAVAVVCTAGSNPSGGVTTVVVDAVQYVAGDEIGVSYTTTAPFTPVDGTTIEAWVEALENPAL